VRRRLERDLDRLGVVAFGEHEHARAVEITALPVEISAAHGLVEGIDRDREVERAAAAAHAPLRGAGLDDGERFAPVGFAHRLGLGANDVAREVAQQVAAGDPRRQREPLLVSRIFDAAFDLEPVPGEVGEANAIADQSVEPLLERRLPKVAGIVA
jgi:hypothetical protein